MMELFFFNLFKIHKPHILIKQQRKRYQDYPRDRRVKKNLQKKYPLDMKNKTHKEEAMQSLGVIKKNSSLGPTLQRHS